MNHNWFQPLSSCLLSHPPSSSHFLAQYLPWTHGTDSVRDMSLIPLLLFSSKS